MDDDYESMSADELLVRVRDWRQVANDRSVEIGRLEQQRAAIDVALRDTVAERDRLQTELADAMATGQSMEGQCHDLETERDRLRAIVERAHDHVGLDEHVLRTLSTDDLVALVSVLRQDAVELRGGYAKATVAADAAAEAVGNMAEYASQAVAERDRLRAVVDAAANAYVPFEGVRRIAHGALPALADALDQLDSETPPAQRILADYARDLEAERDRLRAVVDAVSVMWDNVVHANPEGTLMGFPLSDYDTLERALDALDVSPEATDG
jgi:hypothetical protein